jgi:enediyne biosynthesis protein E4
MPMKPRLANTALKGVVVWVLVGVIWWAVRLPQLTPVEAASMSKRFRFEREILMPIHAAKQTHRNVNPELQGIVSWISTVGAGVALGDLDGDGLANDYCLVDPRTDDVIISPVPGTGKRYAPFTLQPDASLFDPATMAPMGCLMADLNEDGLMDLVVYYWGRTPVAFLRRDAGTPLSSAGFLTQQLLPGKERWYTNAGLVADMDGDGHADLVFGNYFADGSVVLGGNGRVEMQSSMSRASNGGSKTILLWKSATAGAAPKVEYKRAGEIEPVLGTGWTLAMAACDIDGDLLPELYIANDFGPDVLLHNQSTPGHLAFQRLHGQRGWTTPKSKVIGQDSFKGMGVDCADLNGDGIPDFMVSNITDAYALEESNLVYVSTGDARAMSAGKAPYKEVGESLGLARGGWSWDVRFADFDNDGVPEIVQATGFAKGSVDRWPELQELAMGNDLMLRHPAHWPHFASGDDLSGANDHTRFFVRSRSGEYFDLAPDVGFSGSPLTRGLAVGDVDGDGRQDLLVANQWGDSFLFHNTTESSGTFLGLHVLVKSLPGETSISHGHRRSESRTSPAIGARVTVYFPDGQRTVKQVDGGNGHSGKNSPDLLFGLGENKLPLRVAFDWRDRHGAVRHQESNLAPGWHTVQLAGLDSADLHLAGLDK